MRTAVVINRAGYLLALLCALFVACAQLGLPAPETMRERIAAAQGASTQLRASATQLLNAKKISSADATNVLKTTDAAAEGIALAMQISATDPAGADTRLKAAVAVLGALQAYLATKGN